ncbi:MAG TPA: hypothetical protein VLF67_00015, partial [Candidatus Saccharimonas sp.]|nr:hypothetical protein [Candidatus Saccharimonas sp.]
MSKQLLVYIPVVHAGYITLFDRHLDADEVLLIGPDFTRDWPILAKEIRALEPKLALASLQAIYPRLQLRIIGPADLPSAVTATT